MEVYEKEHGHSCTTKKNATSNNSLLLESQKIKNKHHHRMGMSEMLMKI